MDVHSVEILFDKVTMIWMLYYRFDTHNITPDGWNQMRLPNGTGKPMQQPNDL